MTETLDRHRRYRTGALRNNYLANNRKYRESEKGRETAEAYRERRNALRRFGRNIDNIRRALSFGFTPQELAKDYNVPLDRIIQLKVEEGL